MPAKASEHEVKGQSFPEYFQIHLSRVLLMLNRLKAVKMFQLFKVFS